MQNQIQLEAIRYSRELLLRAHTYCGVLEDMILSLDNRPYDEDYILKRLKEIQKAQKS